MSEDRFLALIEQVMFQHDRAEVRKLLGLALAAEAEACAAMMVAGELCEIHSNVVQRAGNYRSVAVANDAE